MPAKFPIFIVDGSSYLSQVYYKPKSTTIDRTVEHLPVYKFCRMLRKLIAKFNVAHIVIVWDGRKEIKPAVGYREEKKIAMEIIKFIEMEQIIQPNIASYDIIFSMVKSFNNQDHNIVIITNNKNMYALVNEATTIFDPFAKIRTKATIDKNNLEKKYKFSVSKFPLFLALAGDTTAHISGVFGIGEKQATTFAQKFKNLDEIYNNIDTFTNKKIRLALSEGKKDAYDSLEKALPHGYQNPTTLAQTAFHEKNWELVLPLFQKYGYKKLISDIKIMPTVKESIIERVNKLNNSNFELILITTRKQLENLSVEIKKIKYFSIDVQGSALDPMTSNPLSISIAIDQKSVFYIPLSNQQNENLITQEDLIASLSEICKDQTIEKIFRKAQFNLVLLEQINLEVDSSIFDITIATSFVMHDWENNGLEELTRFYIKKANLSYQNMHTNNNKKLEQVGVDQNSWNSIADTHQSIILREYLIDELKKEEVLKNFQSIEMPISHILAKMEIAGISCNKAMLEKFNTKLTHDIEKLTQEINNYSKGPININSTPQIRHFLFKTLKLPIEKKLSKTRNYSTDAFVLKELSALHPVPRLILRYRELYKLQRPYVENLLKTINQKTKKIHPIWEQALSISGRISAKHPNIQSIPAHGQDFTSSIRSAFHTDNNSTFIAVDYNDLELRIIAHLSQDKGLKAALTNSDDVHRKIAARLFFTTEHKVTFEQRSIAKKINLSISYGLTAYGLAKDQNIPYRKAAFAIKTFFTQFPSVRIWLNKTIEKTRTDGYIATMFGRKRYIPNIRSRNRIIYDATIRIAINTIIQGSATEIVKIGMIKLAHEIRRQKLSSQLILNIHDQLVLTSPKSEIEKITTIAMETLTHVVNWDIPLKIIFLTGHTWQDITTI